MLENPALQSATLKATINNNIISEEKLKHVVLTHNNLSWSPLNYKNKLEHQRI
jgi:hypothetical protein